MPHYTEYKCSECGRVPANRSDLVTKMVYFKEIGSKSILRSRTIGWLCKDVCLPVDEHYNLPAFQTPGMKSAPLERVRKAKQDGA